MTSRPIAVAPPPPQSPGARPAAEVPAPPAAGTFQNALARKLGTGGDGGKQPQPKADSRPAKDQPDEESAPATLVSPGAVVPFQPIIVADLGALLECLGSAGFSASSSPLMAAAGPGIPVATPAPGTPVATPVPATPVMTLPLAAPAMPPIPAAPVMSLMPAAPGMPPMPATPAMNPVPPASVGGAAPPLPLASGTPAAGEEGQLTAPAAEHAAAPGAAPGPQEGPVPASARPPAAAPLEALSKALDAFLAAASAGLAATTAPERAASPAAHPASPAAGTSDASSGPEVSRGTLPGPAPAAQTAGKTADAPAPQPPQNPVAPGPLKSAVAPEQNPAVPDASPAVLNPAPTLPRSGDVPSAAASAPAVARTLPAREEQPDTGGETSTPQKNSRSTPDTAAPRQPASSRAGAGTEPADAPARLHAQFTGPGTTGIAAGPDRQTEPHPLHAPLSLPPEAARNVVDQVIKGLMVHVGVDVQEMRLTLKPESLGEVLLQVRMEEGKMQAQIEVAQPAVKAAVEGQMADLRQALSARGIEVQNITVLTSGQSATLGERRGNSTGRFKQKGGRRAEAADPEGPDPVARSMGYNTLELIM